MAVVLGEDAQYGGHDVRLVVRSGCYVVHDHGTYAQASPLNQRGADRPALDGALEVWADVLSVPEPGLAIVGLGRRDVSYDLGLPVTLAVGRPDGGRVEPFAGWALSDLNDQHGIFNLPINARPWRSATGSVSGYRTPVRQLTSGGRFYWWTTTTKYAARSPPFSIERS